ncbi:MAG: hypothetical protein AAGE03_04315, partial [Pseudomonadota bacterium]
PEDWSVAVVFRPAGGGLGYEVSAVAGGVGYNFTAGASETGALTPGEWVWSLIATHRTADQRERLDIGRVTILPDPTGVTDTRTANERILASINAALEGRATKDADSYTIEGRSIARTPIPDLLRLQAVYERRVSAERNPGNPFLSFRRVRFT